MKKLYKIILSIFFAILIAGCTVSKKDLELKNAFKNYLSTRNIDYEENDSIYSKYYSDFLKDELYKNLSANIFIELNKVYVNQELNHITFRVFSDDGREYFTSIKKNDTTILTEPKRGIITLRKALKMEFSGYVELTDSIIKISNNIRALSGREWNTCDVGLLQKDTIRLVENYKTKKYSYKKKWLAKTYRTNLKLVYQPNLKATRHEATKTRNPFYLVEGSFYQERNLKDEKILKMMENVKY